MEQDYYVHVSSSMYVIKTCVSDEVWVNDMGNWVK